MNSMELSGVLARWDYKTVKLHLRGFLGGKIDQKELDRILAEASAEGWELVQVLATALYQGRTQDAVLIFKRPQPAGA